MTAEGPARPVGAPFGKIAGVWFVLAGALIAGMLAGAALAPQWLAGQPWKRLTERLLTTQDWLVLITICVTSGLWLVFRGPAAALATGIALPKLRARPRAIAAGLAIACFLLTWAGTWLVYDDYALSMDEFMANFDAVFLAHGTLMARLPEAWRPFAHGLQPMFVFMTADKTAWSSAYLPVNAALRALGGLVAARSAVSPFLAAVSVLATFAVGRRLWPARPDLALLAAVLLATSSQVLVTAMTAYAMTAHLAFNMIWLWLFLRGGRAGHAGAIAVGFLASGLHQFVFHPLFVAPFVLQLLLERRWSAAALYILAYAAICAFWLAYWPLAFATMSSGAPTVHEVGAGAARMGDWAWVLVRSLDAAAPRLMIANLIRFVTWQNLLVPPLALIGGVAAFKAKGTLRSLALGFVVTGAAIAVVMPYQGHGWGYRYWHGLLGSAALLAAFAWSRLTGGLPQARKPAAHAGLAALTAVSLFGLFPLRAWQAHKFVHPYALAEAAIRRSSAQVVLIDDTRAAFTIDLTRNDPYLASAPHVLAMRFISLAQVRDLCSRYTVALFGPADAHRFGIGPDPDSEDDERVPQRLAVLRACGVPRQPVGGVGA
ncbi:MAG TPA: hypothetical protein VG166_03495 [Caulobacteraceae bacterium]|nr:hypothetical protein [Caulobacteraceae bacterium]